MSKIYRSNPKVTTEDPTGEPDRGGDTYDAYDIIRDQDMVLDNIGETIRQMYGKLPVLLESSKVSIAATGPLTVRIGGFKAWIATKVNITDDYSVGIPPTTREEVLTARFVDLSGDNIDNFPGTLNIVAAPDGLLAIVAKFTEKEGIPSQPELLRDKRANGPLIGDEYSYLTIPSVTFEFAVIEDSPVTPQVPPYENTRPSLWPQVTGPKSPAFTAPIPEWYTPVDTLIIGLVRKTGAAAVVLDEFWHPFRSIRHLSQQSHFPTPTIPSSETMPENRNSHGILSYAEAYKGAGILPDPNFELGLWSVGQIQSLIDEQIKMTIANANFSLESKVEFVTASGQEIYPMSYSGELFAFERSIGHTPTLLIICKDTGGFSGVIQATLFSYRRGTSPSPDTGFLVNTSQIIQNIPYSSQDGNLITVPPNSFSGPGLKVFLIPFSKSTDTTASMFTFKISEFLDDSSVGSFEIHYAQLFLEKPSLSADIIQAIGRSGGIQRFAIPTFVGPSTVSPVPGMSIVWIDQASRQIFSFGGTPTNININFSELLPWHVSALIVRINNVGNNNNIDLYTGSTGTNILVSSFVQNVNAGSAFSIPMPISAYGGTGGVIMRGEEIGAGNVDFEVLGFIL